MWFEQLLGAFASLLQHLGRIFKRARFAHGCRARARVILTWTAGRGKRAQNEHKINLELRIMTHRATPLKVSFR